jgi:acyl-coenzyme A thioesterase PaaI-like protein
MPPTSPDEYRQQQSRQQLATPQQSLLTPPISPQEYQKQLQQLQTPPQSPLMPPMLPQAYQLQQSQSHAAMPPLQHPRPGKLGTPPSWINSRPEEFLLPNPHDKPPAHRPAASAYPSPPQSPTIPSHSLRPTVTHHPQAHPTVPKPPALPARPSDVGRAGKPPPNVTIRNVEVGEYDGERVTMDLSSADIHNYLAEIGHDPAKANAVDYLRTRIQDRASAEREGREISGRGTTVKAIEINGADESLTALGTGRKFVASDSLQSEFARLAASTPPAATRAKQRPAQPRPVQTRPTPPMPASPMSPARTSAVSRTEKPQRNPIIRDVDVGEYNGQRVTMDLSGADIRDYLASIGNDKSKANALDYLRTRIQDRASAESEGREMSGRGVVAKAVKMDGEDQSLSALGTGGQFFANPSLTSAFNQLLKKL